MNQINEIKYDLREILGLISIEEILSNEKLIKSLEKIKIFLTSPLRG